MLFPSINPYTGKTFHETKGQSDAAVAKTIEKADVNFRQWRTLPFKYRADLLQRAADVLRTNRDKYALLMVREMGKVIKEARSEVDKCALVCDYYAENGEQFLSDEDISVPDGKAIISYEPLGVILAVMPWNFPFWQVFRFAAPTLMAGNIALLKHASNVPLCALAIEEVFIKAGFPEGVFQSLIISSSQTQPVIDDYRVKAVTLTGSEKAGAAVASRAGKKIKKSVLELGGSDPFIVLQDADVALAAKIAAKSRMINCGQSCIAAKRFIIEQSVYDEFVALFIDQIGQLNYGDPESERTDYGPMAKASLAEELALQLKRSNLTDENILHGTGWDKEAIFHPVIIKNPAWGSPADQEELFGPVAVCYMVKNAEEAVAKANNSIFGLGGSLWTNNTNTGVKIAKSIETGAVYINKMMASHPAVPFGGIKMSGYGRELSRSGILEFVNHKSIWIA